jgi:hypothetical protein
MTAPLNARALVGSHDILLMTIDTLRYDVAMEAHRRGETPCLSSVLPGGGWEKRHSPGSFTYAAHHAFFAGFLPTPARPGRHSRLFAPRFEGSETTGATTFVFDTPDIVSGLAHEGYHTVCIGGVGFFNKRTPLGAVLPGLFAESWWDESLGVTCPDSTANQVRLAVSRINETLPSRRLFLFLNISACHQPNRHYLPAAEEDTPESQRAALAYVDRQLPPLFAALRARAPLLAIILSDHGTAYGEDGYSGHRLAHPVVWEVPYVEAVLPQTEAER